MTAVAVPQAAMQDFQQRLLEKLRADIGALLPDEALAAMVQGAVNDLFFKPGELPNPEWTQYNYKPRTIPTESWFQAEILKLVSPMVQTAVDKAVALHAKSALETGLREYLTENRLQALMADAIARESGRAMVNAVGQVINEIRNSGGFRV